jgi:hypothetical protein
MLDRLVNLKVTVALCVVLIFAAIKLAKELTWRR